MIKKIIILILNFTLSKHIRILFFILISSSSLAWSECDENVKNMNTSHLNGISLCELQSRYKEVMHELSNNGISDPNHVGNAFAPRFINMPNWLNYLIQKGDSEQAAWNVYNPAPITWKNWATAAALIDNPNFNLTFFKGTNDEILNKILKLHSISMTGLLNSNQVGNFRTNDIEIIPLLSSKNAYTLAQIKKLKNLPFASLKTGMKLATFTSKQCDDVSQDYKQLQIINRFFLLNKISSNAPIKECGVLTMAPPDEVLAQMNLWINKIRNDLKELEFNPKTIDIVKLASEAQQWMVIIHPFVDGNGRMSRFMMESIFRKYNLPAPTLEDMNQDFFSTPNEWADLVGQGLLNTVTQLEICLKKPNNPGCMVVSNFDAGE